MTKMKWSPKVHRGWSTKGLLIHLAPDQRLQSWNRRHRQEGHWGEVQGHEGIAITLNTEKKYLLGLECLVSEDFEWDHSKQMARLQTQLSELTGMVKRERAVFNGLLDC
jgi:hypothetical protein